MPGLSKPLKWERVSGDDPGLWSGMLFVIPRPREASTSKYTWNLRHPVGLRAFLIPEMTLISGIRLAKLDPEIL